MFFMYRLHVTAFTHDGIPALARSRIASPQGWRPAAARPSDAFMFMASFTPPFSMAPAAHQVHVHVVHDLAAAPARR